MTEAEESGQLLTQIRRDLDVIVALLSKNLPKESEESTGRNQIRLLAQLGLAPAEIARILSKRRTDVNSELAHLRKNLRKAR